MTSLSGLLCPLDPFRNFRWRAITPLYIRLAILAALFFSPMQQALCQTAPTITWATPSPIVYGIALSATQLNATANVAGTFSYSPAAGTVLVPGSQTLSVTFTPDDTTDYSTATATVTLNVLAIPPAGFITT